MRGLTSEARVCPGAPAFCRKRASWQTCQPLLPWTTSKSVNRIGADACFAVAEQASGEVGPVHVVLVVLSGRVERPAVRSRLSTRGEVRTRARRAALPREKQQRGWQRLRAGGRSRA